MSDPVVPRKDNSQDVIPGNVAEEHVPGKITRCTVNIEHLGDSIGRNVLEPSALDVSL